MYRRAGRPWYSSLSEIETSAGSTPDSSSLMAFAWSASVSSISETLPSRPMPR